MTNNPDNWVIIDLGDNLYKVLAGWSGGYIDGDSWQINSGIVKIEEHEKYYFIYGESGSIYKCDKRAEKLRFNVAYIWKKIKKELPNVKLVSINNIKHKFNN